MQTLNLFSVALLLHLTSVVGWSSSAIADGTHRPPPRGWRSWIAYGRDADQAKMQAAIESIHKPRALGEQGKMVSLLDLGYSDVGLDGGWARCDGVNGSYHDKDGKLLINSTKFPSFAAMNKLAHSRGLTSSWYLNIDQCLASQKLIQGAVTDEWYTNDANLLAHLEFDGVKFDTQPGGPNWNITKWSMALKATGRDIVIEDCLDKHPDGTLLPKSSNPKIDILDNPEECPFEFYRTGGDNYPTFYRGMYSTLTEMEPFLNKTSPVRASRPGCWAYPDMVSIGQSSMQQNWIQRGCDPLSAEEEQTLFATWAIVSSPLILSFDVTNDTEVERLWPLIANDRALNINAQWAGEAGHVLARASTTFNVSECWRTNNKINTFPSWVVWSKQLANPPDSVAVLAINIAETAQSIDIAFDDLVKAGAGGKKKQFDLIGTDVWSGQVIKKLHQGSVWKEHLSKAHESKFIIFSPAGSSVDEDVAMV